MPTAAEIGVDAREVVLSILQLDGKESRDEFTMLCPDPAHEDQNPSASVNLQTGLWNCLSCGRKGDLVGLVSLVVGIPRTEALQRLRRGDRQFLLRHLENRLAGAQKAVQGPLPGPYEDEPLYYLRNRGFTDETLSRFGVRYVHEDLLQREEGPVRVFSSMAIPIKDRSGKQTAWIYRSIIEGYRPKYLYTPGCKINNIWFGEEHCSDQDDVIVVEGCLDAMKVDQVGFRALAALGSSPSSDKLRMLRRYRSVTLFGDRDPAGIRMVKIVGEALHGQVPVKVVRYPKDCDATDPGGMSEEIVMRCVTRAIPFLSWVLFKN